MNLYDYVGQDPVNFVDPSGLLGYKMPTSDPLPELPQWIINGATGFGDGIWSAITLGMGDLQDTRDLIGIDGGIDKCSWMYKDSRVTGNIVGGSVLAGSVAAKFKLFEKTTSNKYIEHRSFTVTRKNGLWNTGRNRFGWSSEQVKGSYNNYHLMLRTNNKHWLPIHTIRVPK